MANTITFGREGKKITTESVRDDGQPNVVNDLGDDKDSAQVKKRSDRSALAAVKLKLAGATYAEIAQLQEYSSPAAARLAVERAIADSGDSDVDYKMMRAIASAQLDGLMKSVAARALDKNDSEHLAYVRQAVSIIDRKAKLWGLDAPVKMEVSNPSVDEFNAMVDKFVQEMGGEVEEADIFTLEQAPDGVTWGPADEEP
jgi:hypothetical protein